MEIKDNKIIFTVDKKKIDSFVLAANLLEKDPDMLFEDWLLLISERALRHVTRTNRPERFNDSTDQISYEASKLPPEIVRSRIIRWSRNKDGSAFQIISIFFEFYDKNKDHIVKRDEMRTRYFELNPGKKGRVLDFFIMIFRQMCSNAERAYGSIFKYNNDNKEDEVILDPEFANYVLELKSQFVIQK